VKVVHDCPAARWLPSRHHFALMRLFAFVRFRSEDPMPPNLEHLALAIDRDQSAIEIYGVSLWLFATAVAYVAVLLPVPLGWAVALAIPVAGIAMQIPLTVIGGILIPLWTAVTGVKLENLQKLESVATMTLMVIASSYFAVARSPVRYIGWFFFAVFLLNAAAWLIMAALRTRVEEMERQCGL